MISRTATRLGPRHHGRRMSLKAFEFAPVEPGYLYELARGYVLVSEVANVPTRGGRLSSASTLTTITLRTPRRFTRFSAAPNAKCSSLGGKANGIPTLPPGFKLSCRALFEAAGSDAAGRVWLRFVRS